MLYIFSKQSDILSEHKHNSNKIKNLLIIHGHNEEVCTLWKIGVYFNP